ncbi:hypothetical protein PG993_001539 [Apiospora rasikravindrae]|uniref:Uncharacterized protein n=1 Tax=Apiospora rasikravindrae TaxID=990691 RepID=A0ABR1UBQ0_9PEZI
MEANAEGEGKDRSPAASHTPDSTLAPNPTCCTPVFGQGRFYFRNLGVLGTFRGPVRETGGTILGAWAVCLRRGSIPEAKKGLEPPPSPVFFFFLHICTYLGWMALAKTVISSPSLPEEKTSKPALLTLPDADADTVTVTVTAEHYFSERRFD